VTSLTNRIQKIFDKLKSENKKAFVSFSVGGYPDEESSLEIAKAIANSGSHIHEISFPHAEAQADGPIIQLANIESINKGINLKKIIDISKKVRDHNSEIGLCLMGYLNNLFIYGIEKFAKDISGIIDAVICVDLPSDVVEEKQLRDSLKKENIALIKLITPTTSDERIKEIVKDAEGFIYSVNVEGQTGVKSANLDRVNLQIEKIKKYTTIPVVSGFGIKNEDDVKTFSKSKADGIVLGSAIVNEIQKKSSKTMDKHIIANFLTDYCKKLINNLNT
jgi:tryptophan synthase alpha chain